MRCDEIMSADVAVVGTGQSVVDAAKLMRDLNVGFIPVCQSDGSVIGTITDRDLVLRVIAEGRPFSATVQDVMSSDLVTCKPSDDLAVAEEMMRSNQVDRVLVIDDDGTLGGVISLADLAQYEEDEGQLGRLTADIFERETHVPH